LLRGRGLAGSSGGTKNAHFKGKIRYKASADDAHPRRGHLSLHDDSVRGGPRAERASARRGYGGRQKIFLATQHDASIDDPKPDEIYTVGCIVNIVQSLKLQDGNIKVLVEGVERGKVVSVSGDEGFLRVVLRTAFYKVEPGPQLDALISRVTGLFDQYVKLSQNLNYEQMIAAIRVDDPGSWRIRWAPICSSLSKRSRSCSKSSTPSSG